MMTGQRPSLCKSKFAKRWGARSRTTFAKPETREESVVVHAMVNACPKCGSSEYLTLGELGLVLWVRCRMCGWDFSLPTRDTRTTRTRRKRVKGKVLLAYLLLVFILSLGLAILLSLLMGKPHLPYNRSALVGTKTRE